VNEQIETSSKRCYDTMWNPFHIDPSDRFHRRTPSALQNYRAYDGFDNFYWQLLAVRPFLERLPSRFVIFRSIEEHYSDYPFDDDARFEDKCSLGPIHLTTALGSCAWWQRSC
jgi:hypothetical protein